MATTTLLLVGSAVDEFHAALSRLYARSCAAALSDTAEFDVHVAYVGPDGSWRFPHDLSDHAIETAPAMSLEDAMAHLGTLAIDVMLPQMFCRPGMTTYRGLFDVLGIPYLGNRPDVMSVGLDKAKARAVVAATGVPVPRGEVVQRGEWPSVPLPVVVKPVDADNSVGLTLVREPADLAAALASAHAHGSAALVESYVELGREVRCGIIVRDGELVCLPLEEYAVDEATHPIRYREDKLARADDGELYLVAKDAKRAWIVTDDGELTQRVWELARRCHVALGCRHYSLFDFRVDPQGRPWFLEAGLYCSYAPSSVLAVMAAAIGLNVCDLLALGTADLNRGKSCSTSSR